MLCHRHLPHQLVHGGTRDWEEPAAAAGEQHLDKGRLEPLRAYHYYSMKMVCNFSAGENSIPVCYGFQIFYLCTRKQVQTNWLTGVKVN